MEDFYEKDVNKIIALTVKYCWALDERDWDSLSQVFSSDACAKYGITEHKGVESIIERCKKALVPLDFSHHMVSNHVVEIEGDIDISSLEASFLTLIKRHRPLRSNLFQKNGELLQRSQDMQSLTIPINDFRHDF